MLNQAEVVRHLVRAGHLDGRRVLDGDLRIDEVPRRNRGFKVQSVGGPCYFVKQGIDAEGDLSVAREASAYQYLNSIVPPGEIQRALPRFHGYDESDRILVLGLSPGSLSFREYHARRGRIPEAAAAATGRALAGLHRVPLPGESAGRDCETPPSSPWALSLHRPDIRILRIASGANLELLRMIQEFPDFCRLLEGLRDEWRPVSLIHFDLKADNLVMTPSPEGVPRGHEVRMVDWEASGPGDPCWDVGSVFSDFLGFWIFSLPVLPGTPPRRFMELTRFPLDRMAPAIRAFWGAYVGALGLAADEARETLLLSVRYSAGRLLQTAFEQLQTAPRLSGNIVCLLQLSWNVLERPAEAATRLLGLSA